MIVNIKGLAIDKNNDGNCPRFICQYCGQPIQNKEGNHEFGIYYDENGGIIAHKECDNKVRGEKRYSSWEEAPGFMFDLLWNTRVIPKDEPYRRMEGGDGVPLTKLINEIKKVWKK